jgi:anti-anti-sigma factor
MNVKIDTKEKFTVITPSGDDLPANMTGELQKILNSYLLKKPAHVILNMEKVNSIDPAPAEMISTMQQTFYDNKASFVLCSLQPAVEKMFDEMNLLALMNVTPTESEAWDIVQMEEIERELLNDFDEEGEL